VEKNFKTAMIMSEGQFSDILSHPIAVVFLAVSLLFVVWPMFKSLVKWKKKPA
jgi:TctA family transporter